MLSNKPENTAQNRARIEVLINSAFKREVIRKVVDVILPLNDIGDGPPFYCIHAAAGVATEFQYLVRMLGPNQKFYAIQVPTDRRRAGFARSIEEHLKIMKMPHVRAVAERLSKKIEEIGEQIHATPMDMQ